MESKKIKWVKQNSNCYFGYLSKENSPDVMVFQLAKYSKWDTYRQGMWTLEDLLYHKGIFPCKTKELAMEEAQCRVDKIFDLVAKI